MTDTETRRPARLLIAGFGPYPDVPRNPASHIAHTLAAEGVLAGVGVRAITVPTLWGHAADAVFEAAEDCSGVLLLGVDPAAPGFTVEMRARNVAGRRRDAAGEKPANRRISAVGPAVGRSTAPVASMVEAIARESFAARASSDAGDYLCNYVFYRLLTEAPGLVSGLVHVPLNADIEALAGGTRAAAFAFAAAVRTPRVFAEA